MALSSNVFQQHDVSSRKIVDQEISPRCEGSHRTLSRWAEPDKDVGMTCNRPPQIFWLGCLSDGKAVLEPGHAQWPATIN